MRATTLSMARVASTASKPSDFTVAPVVQAATARRVLQINVIVR